ncbi:MULTISPECIES: XrtA system polysaccharide chain length determinant [unclassified Sphingomonas]|jgi:polysaccharide chain length determinant protein (PEP-CTERM system associated)|uniref:XrtA system polysaccharide chain length determinant n=2 Tax=Bacteria TaxID=2 RepID=UPI000E10E081|nr:MULTISPECIES: XrtA system polysaccharide chain length determinant [unclassified Sphingomonas]AXJ94268.1 chain-length determining protein [Sphingomonas sp. FARSPH]
MNGIYDEARLALHAIWTRRWLALAVAWGVCVLGWFFVSQMPSRYESRARVFVQMQSILPATMDAPAGQAQQDVDTVRQTLISAVNLEKVVRGTDLANTVSSDRDVADRVAGLASAIKVESQQNNLFQITTTASSPKLAKAITQKLIDIFVEQNLGRDRTQTSQSLDFLNKQLQQLQGQLNDAEAKRADFQNRYLGALPGTGSVSDRIGAARSQMAQVDSDLAAAQSSLAAVQGQMAGTAQTIPGAGGVTGGPARAALAAVQGQLADARARGYTDQHPDVIALKRQLAAAQAAARGEPTGTAGGGTPNPLYLSLQSMAAEKQSTVASLKMRKAQLQGDLDQLNAKLARDPEVAAQQGQIDRDYQVLKAQYDQLLAQRQQIAMRGQAQTQTDSIKFSVIDPPTLPRTPTAPNRMLLLTGVLIVGLGAGVAAAFLLGQLRATFATATRLERATGMPVIGSIGEVVTRVQADQRAKRLKLFLGGAAGLGAAFVLLLCVEVLQRGMAA